MYAICVNGVLVAVVQGLESALVKVEFYASQGHVTMRPILTK